MKPHRGFIDTCENHDHEQRLLWKHETWNREKIYVLTQSQGENKIPVNVKKDFLKKKTSFYL